MRDQPKPDCRSILRFALLAATALALTGCADSSRFGDPLGNPFGGQQVDRSPTGSVPAPRRMAANDRIVGQPLEAPRSSGSSFGYQPQQSSAGSAPVAAAPQSDAPPAGPSRGPAISSSNWTSQGGTPIVMAQGESVNTLADRYGIPADALVRTNGYSSASQIQPGAKLTIPVYSVGAGRNAAPEREAQRAAAPVRPASAKPVTAERESAPPQREKLQFMKGPQAARDAKADEKKNPSAAKARLLERTKAARKADADDADDARVSKAKKAAAVQAPTRPAEKPAPVRQAIVQQEVAKPAVLAKAEKMEKPAVASKVARLEDKKATIDAAPTASLPAAEAPKSDKAAADGSPEFRWPARGRVIQGFKAGGNDGINIAVPEGTAVKAAEDGTVAYAGSELKGYGNLVLVRHPNGFVSAYANNGSLDVKRGDSVKRGQTIAKSGQSGNVSSPQLHFELRKGAQPVDPANYLAGM